MKKSVPRLLTHHPYTHHPPHARLGGTGHGSRLIGCPVVSSTQTTSLLIPGSTHSPSCLHRVVCRGGSASQPLTSGQPSVPEVRMAPVGERRSGLKVSAAGLEGGGSPPVETASSSSWIGAAQRVVEETLGSGGLRHPTVLSRQAAASWEVELVCQAMASS